MAERQKSSRKTPTPTPTTRTRRWRSSTTTNTPSRGQGGCSFDGIVDVAAEARKEVANALQLHRSSNNNTSVAATKNELFAGTTYNTTSTAVSNICTCCGSCRGVADCTGSTLLHDHPYCSFSSASSMNERPAFSHLYFQPNYLVSQPIWSTTSPAIFPTPPFTTASDSSTGDGVCNICDEQQEDDQLIDWGDDHLADSSYTWWLGFLKSLDGSGGGAGGVVVSDDGADQICKQPQGVQKQEVHKEDQNLSCLEHYEWLIEPETATN